MFRSVPQSVPLSNLGQDTVPSYETISSNYEEIPAAMKVKGDCTLTQNEAYLTVTGRDNTTIPTEGIYDS